jgi:hypothetical protein
MLIAGCNNPSTTETTTADSTSTQPAAEIRQADFADARYAEIGRKGVDALSAGDVDGWMSGFADNAVYVWNAGDSIAGKAAITAYWKQRRMEVMDSIRFSNHIFLPLKVNQPQSTEQPGVWLLCWYQVDAKYKNGQSMRQWIHTDLHFDNNDKIDRAIQYLDRSVIKDGTK